MEEIYTCNMVHVTTFYCLLLYYAIQLVHNERQQILHRIHFLQILQIEHIGLSSSILYMEDLSLHS